MNAQTAPPRGAAQLLLVLTLVGLAALASAIGSRSALTDTLTRRSAGLAQQARLAAQAALATAEAELLARMTQEADPLASLPSHSCPAEYPAPQWQCTSLPLALPSLDSPPQSWTLQAWLARDLVQAPHVLQLHASALNTGVAAAQTGQRASLFMPSPAPAPSVAPTAAVVQGESLAAISSSSQPCTRAAWRQVLGDITPAQLRAWSEAQERNGLHAQSQPPRSIWWVDNPADWNTSLGDASHPVLLVFSAQACTLRCPRITSNARIHGTVVLDANCDEARVLGWQSGPIEGQLVVEARLPEGWASPQVKAAPAVRQAYALFWPSGIDASRMQRMPGSRWEGP